MTLLREYYPCGACRAYVEWDEGCEHFNKHAEAVANRRRIRNRNLKERQRSSR